MGCIPESPIFANDECDTFPSAANAGTEERATKTAKTTRVFMGAFLSPTEIEEKRPTVQPSQQG
jgi:hypothetical protein